MTEELAKIDAEYREPGEPLVTLAGPYTVADCEDAETGLRFRGGKAVGVPLSVAQRIAKQRRGYYVEPHGRE
jgi:hypothetical protein